jgi:hypothetical protein
VVDHLTHKVVSLGSIRLFDHYFLLFYYYYYFFLEVSASEGNLGVSAFGGKFGDVLCVGEISAGFSF